MQVDTKATVTSEIGTLKNVVVHRPGKELLHIYPGYIDEMLFNEIPWLRGAHREHKQFTDVLEGEGVSVLYLDELVEDVLASEDIRYNFIRENLEYSNLKEPETLKAIFNYLCSLSPKDTVEALIRGLNKEFVKDFKENKTLSDYTKHTFPFYIPPLPSLYFTRDQGVMFENNLFLTSMVHKVRKRERLFIEYVLNHHPLFGSCQKALDINLPKGVEGGDVLVFSEDTIIIGLSQRTCEEAIEKIARYLLLEKEICKELVVIQIPFKKQYLHLDMVLNQVDYDKFLFFPGIENKTLFYKLTPVRGRGYGYIHCEKKPSLRKGLGEITKSPVQIIYSGGSDSLTASREQQSGANNTLTLSPGKIMAYNRNEITNEILAKNGIKVLDFDGSELIRGMGGPRCMSMPLLRQRI